MTPDARAYALWSDWCTAAGHHPHEVTERALADFASIVPAADLDRVRSVAERRRPGPRASRDPWTAVEARWASVEASLARCPTHGWIEGVVGRRDAFLIVATRNLRLTRARGGGHRLIHGSATVVAAAGVLGACNTW